jgi:hypothetical protein
MNSIIVILSGLFQFGSITGLNLFPANFDFTWVILCGLFNGQFLFILKFLGEILLVFFAGGFLGEILHLDRAYKHESHFRS